MLVEEWSVIREFPNYSVSDLGRVVSNQLDREIHKPVCAWGYYSVRLSHNGVRRTKMVHRLVADAFVLGWDVGLVVNHIDGDKLNNQDGNLEWVTHSENTLHAHRTGLMRRAFKPIRIVELGEEFGSVKACAEFLETRPTAISSVLRGVRPSHKGYTFEYI